MSTQNGVYKDATGNLLRCGFQTFTPGAGETARTDVPFPAKVEHDPEEANVTHWTGAVWDEVAQPTAIMKPQRIPPMTTTQRDAMPTPPSGAMVCNTTTDKLNFYDGAAWVEVGGGGGVWEPIGSPVVISSGQATVDVEGDWSLYDKIRIDFTRLVPATNAQLLRGRIRLDGTYETGSSYAWVCSVHNDAGSAVNRSGTSPSIQMHVNTLSNVVGDAASGSIELNNPGSTLHKKQITGRTVLAPSSGEDAAFTDYAGEWDGGTPLRIVNGFRFFMATGNINAMWYRVSGVKT